MSKARKEMYLHAENARALSQGVATGTADAAQVAQVLYDMARAWEKYAGVISRLEASKTK